MQRSQVLVFLAPGFEEIEAITIIDLLRRADLEVTVAGLRPDLITGSHGISVIADRFYVDVDPDDFDCLILPGGQPGTNNLKANPTVLETVRKFYQQNKLIGAICAAPTVLAEAGILKDVKVTSYPSEKGHFNSTDYREAAVVRDGSVVTSRGVGTAIDFSLEIVSILKGNQARDDLALKILWHNKN